MEMKNELTTNTAAEKVMTSVKNGNSLVKAPKEAYENHYVTMNHKEEDYLWRHGIKAVFIDRSSPYGLRKWRYKKNAELFRAIADFYEQEQLNYDFEKNKNLMNSAKANDAAADMFFEKAEDGTEHLKPIHIFGGMEIGNLGGNVIKSNVNRA